MTTHHRILAPAFVAFFTITGCAGLSTSTDAQPGLNTRERGALSKSFYWRPELPTLQYNSTRLDALMRQSADTSLDGERAEEQDAALAVALTTAGDKAFAASLARQSEPVRQAVARSAITYLWTYYGLQYPRTQAILKPGA